MIRAFWSSHPYSRVGSTKCSIVCEPVNLISSTGGRPVQKMVLYKPGPYLVTATFLFRPLRAPLVLTCASRVDGKYPPVIQSHLRLLSLRNSNGKTLKFGRTAVAKIRGGCFFHLGDVIRRVYISRKNSPTGPRRAQHACFFLMAYHEPQDNGNNAFRQEKLTQRGCRVAICGKTA